MKIDGIEHKQTAEQDNLRIEKYPHADLNAGFIDGFLHVKLLA
jgi:hypothetical protein